METLVVIVHVLAALGVTGLVLIQHGKGADMGASFGSGASQTIFGSVGSGNALTKSTTWLATIFFITSLVLALFAKQQAGQGLQDSLLIDSQEQPVEVQEESDVPVSPAPAASDVPALPSTELQTREQAGEQVGGETSEIQQGVQEENQQAQESVAEPPADPATTQEQVEGPAEDLQNATEN